MSRNRSAATPLSLRLGVGWGALWGARTLVVHSLAAVQAATAVGYLHLGMAIVGVVALLAGATVLKGALVARAVFLVSLVVFAGAGLAGVLAGSPVDAALVLAHLVAAVCVLRASPLAHATARRSGVGSD
ncbi:MAG: hypothetical protein A07HB70_00647 [uncultured archaeon A07HB70]|nr:MAG: hypothetical protein A07HB70_00647 [uncultured archaeon A07HB70]